jgi:hypothetical protein
MEILTLLNTLLIFAVTVFVVVKINQMAADLATIARHYRQQEQDNSSPQSQTPQPAKPHNLAGLSRR